MFVRKFKKYVPSVTDSFLGFLKKGFKYGLFVVKLSSLFDGHLYVGQLQNASILPNHQILFGEEKNSSKNHR